VFPRGIGFRALQLRQWSLSTCGRAVRRCVQSLPEAPFIHVVVDSAKCCLRSIFIAAATCRPWPTYEHHGKISARSEAERCPTCAVISETQHSRMTDTTREGQLLAEHIERRLRAHLLRQDHLSESLSPAGPTVELLSIPNLVRSLEEHRSITDNFAAIAAMRGRLIRSMHDRTTHHERIIAELQAELMERDDTIAELRTGLKEREQAIAERREELAGRYRAIAELHAEVAARDRAIVELRAEIRSLTQKEATYSAELATMRARQTQIAATTEHIRSILTSKNKTDATPPVAASAEVAVVAEINRMLHDFSGLRAARETLELHFADSSDPNFATLQATYDEAIREALPYWDIRTAVRILATVIRPRTYLEVGTRRGWSLAQVFAEVPGVRAFVFELWAQDYGGARQGDPDSIATAMQRVVGAGGRPRIEFIDGNSHDTVPTFFAGDAAVTGSLPPQEIDLIAIDGDHTRLGAWWDLCDLMPRVTVGGALVFDDLDLTGDEEIGGRARTEHPRPPLPEHIRSLMDVWGYAQTQYPNFLFLDAPRRRFRAGIALRLA
jgi:predicted O-methyltransferase YrrM